MSFQDQIKKAVDAAPAREVSGFIQYGKLHAEVNVLEWQGKGKEPKRTPFKDGMKIVAGKQSLEARFTIDVQEINPALQFETWSRNLLIEKNSANGKIKTDWQETVLPSLEKVFGDKWPAIFEGKEYYVECEQAPSQYVKEGARDYGAPKFLRKFKNMEECIEARNERFGNPEEAEDFDMGVPEDVVDQAIAVMSTMKGSDEKKREKFAAIVPSSDVFSKYDVDAIFAEIDAREEEDDE